MKDNSKMILPTLSLLFGSSLISGCELVGSIFKAGVWTGTIAVILVLALVIYVVAKLFSRNRNS